MYDEEYAEKWIADYESHKDTFRVKYLEPIISEKIRSLPEKARILDIGCGWGMAAEFLKDQQEYTGVDPTKEFFPYIKAKYPNKKIKLISGKLPDEINAEGNFDFVICSMAIHCTGELKESIRTIFSKVKKHGRVFIIDFNDSAEERLRTKTYIPVYEEDKFHIRGISTLPSGIKVESETFFHKENDFEKGFPEYGEFKKEYVGPLFVSYDIIKK